LSRRVASCNFCTIAVGVPLGRKKALQLDTSRSASPCRAVASRAEGFDLPHAVVRSMLPLRTSLLATKLDWSTGLVLTDGRPVGRIPARRQIIKLQGYDVALRSLLSMARLNSARSRIRPSTWSLVRIDQTCFRRSGGDRGLCGASLRLQLGSAPQDAAGCRKDR